MTRIASYVICTSPRSGSTLLCDLLHSSGVAGNPQSWFHRPSFDAWAEALGVSLQPEDQAANVTSLFTAAREQGSARTDLFGLRLQRDSFDFFFRALRGVHPDGLSDLACFERSFGPTMFIHLSREDKVAQAVSCVRAMQSGLWHVATDGSERERAAPHREPHFDDVAIATHVEQFTQADRLWTAWFAEQGIEPVRVSYAQLSSEPTLVTGQILAKLGADPSAADQIEPGVRKMADGLSDDWIQRFRAHPGL